MATRGWQVAVALVAIVGVATLARVPQSPPEPQATASPDTTASAPSALRRPSHTPAEPRRTADRVHPGLVEPAPPVIVGEWTNLPPAPLDIPTAHAGVWTGTELLVGFETAVAGYDPATGLWRSIQMPPRLHRRAPQVVWTGRHVAVVGGFTADEGAPPRTDVVLLDPRDGSWSELGSPPAIGKWVPAVAWSGSELVVWGGTRPGDVEQQGRWPVAGAAYDPVSGSWRVIPPAPVEGVWTAKAAWTGTEVLFWGLSHPSPDPNPAADDPPSPEGVPYAVAFDPAANVWRELDPPPLQWPASDGSVWTGQQLVVFGAPPPARDTTTPLPRGLRLDPRAGAWVEAAPVLDGSSSDDDLYGFVSAWTGADVILYGGYPRPLALLYRPSTDAWMRIDTDGAHINAVLAWTGEELLLWGGYGGSGPDVELRSWRGRP